MKTLHLLCLILLPLLTGCIEIIDDLSLNTDGSGTFKYTINLSSSKVKVNSLLALDSLDGKKVPSIQDISAKTDEIVDLLKCRNGISNVSFSADYDNFIFKLSCDFNSLEALQKAIREVVKVENGYKEVPELDHHWLSFEDDVLVRSIPQITVRKTREINPEDRDLLKTGTYTSITRFESEVERCENPSCSISKNKKAVMVRTNTYSLTQNPNLLDNTIYLTKSEN
ncbi:MAG: hypothetical protein A3D92_05675 [Bacteroidetes bacterium RIFCSPHIGHO2_02_FULL_44_7]|nr:MAG: hypothetical protein A3D92_05675 [Bacteroidetes bacterium RIFCSPHIGHO2_02_FULL_44_7]